MGRENMEGYKRTRPTFLNLAPSKSDQDPALLNLLSLKATMTALLGK
jgi:hypothetical protein